MLLLTAERININVFERPLLKDAVLGIYTGEKIGLIGKNGAGKSTLLKIVAGVEEPDSGTVTRSGKVRVGYLPQNPIFEQGVTVLEQAMRDTSGQPQESKEYECKAILTRFGINDFDQPVCALSGGQKKRVSLAGVLVSPSDLLLLDEPTNHMDNDMVDWLEGYLANYNGAILMVTHDRYFLDRVTNKILELQDGSLFAYPGNYAKFLELKTERAEMSVASERKRQSLLKKELEWIQRGPRARATKQRYRVERFEEMSNQKVNLDQEKLQMNSMHARLGKKIIEVDCISKAYGDRRLFHDFSYNLLRGDRIGIIGANGCGKTTLLKNLVGLTAVDSGTVTVGETVRIGYFSQECEEMDMTIRAIDYIKDIAGEVEMPDGTLTASQMMERFLFTSDLQYSPISKLSGGERRKLYLLGILIQAPNVLLFDEPTNDLDIETLTILEDYLADFAGAVIVVSHDRYFLDKVAEHIFVFGENGEIRDSLGGYSTYLEDKKIREEPQKAKSSKDKASNRTKAERVKFTFNEQREYDRIDDVIAELEKQISETEQQIEQQTSNYLALTELIAKKEQLEADLSAKMDRWVYLNNLSEQIEEQRK